jgi:hypothetical protein
MRIDQKQCEDLAMAWYSGIRKFERLDLVLKYVRESEQAAVPAVDAADILDRRALLNAKDFGQPVPVVLFIVDLIEFVGRTSVAEC